MTGDDRIRFCQSCKLNVYNISQMTTEEAEKLITRKEGRICVRMYRRRDGTLLNMDCPVGRLKKRLATACGAVSAMVSLFVVWIMQGKAAAPGGFTQGAVEMGDIAVSQPIQPQIQSLPPPINHDFVMGRLIAQPQPMATNDGLPQEIYMGGRHGEPKK